MAVMTSGAQAAPAPSRSPIPATSRTRRHHGTVAFLGGDLCAVYSPRHFIPHPMVMLRLSERDDPSRVLIGKLTPQAARELARALLAGAEAVDMAQRTPPIDRLSGVRFVRTTGDAA